MFRKNQIVEQTCPVCPAKLGKRNTAVFFMAKCDECQFYYSWEPNSDKPKAQSCKSVDKKICGCSGCRAKGR